MKTTMMEKDMNHYIKRFKTFLNNGGIDRNAELAMLSAYGVESCKDMNLHELIELCAKVELMVNPDLAKLDKLRKRVIATISGYIVSTGRECGIEYIKTIACRAAEVNEFNRISETALNSIIGEFARKQKVAKNVKAIKAGVEDEMRALAAMN
jgi:hypothetical protein